MDSVMIPMLVNDTNAETPIPVQTASVIISLIINDENDETPRFKLKNNRTSFELQVLETMKPPADTSLTVQAEDRDKNDVIRYSLNDPSRLFSITGTSGVVRLQKTVNYEELKEVIMQVTATDSKGHNATAIINVTIIDVNDNNPIFTKFQTPVEVSEGENVGYVVTVVEATDKDSGVYGTVGYFLNNDGGGHFEINQTSVSFYEI